MCPDALIGSCAVGRIVARPSAPPGKRWVITCDHALAGVPCLLQGGPPEVLSYIGDPGYSHA